MSKILNEKVEFKPSQEILSSIDFLEGKRKDIVQVEGIIETEQLDEDVVEVDMKPQNFMLMVAPPTMAWIIAVIAHFNDNTSLAVESALFFVVYTMVIIFYFSKKEKSTKKKQKMPTLRLIALVSIGICSLSGVGGVYTENMTLLKISAVFFIIGTIFGILANNRVKSLEKVENPMLKFKDFYKDKIILPLLKNLDKNATYLKDKSIKKIYKQIGGSKGEDLIGLNIDGIGVEFGEVLSYQRDDDDRLIEYRHIVCVASFNKKLKNYTYVSSLSSLSARAGDLLKYKPSKYIKLDNHKFNEYFAVRTDDEIEARYILTHNMMEKMLEFEKISQTISFLFEDDKIIFSFLTFHGYKGEQATYDFLDYTPNFSIHEQTKKHFDTINMLINIIKSLNLNSKIWK